MSQQTAEPAIPAWTLGWRLQRALAHAEMKAETMADELGVSRQTVSRWMNDRGAAPRAIYVKEWALRCGVPHTWLAFGIEPEDGDGGTRDVLPAPSRCTALRLVA